MIRADSAEDHHSFGDRVRLSRRRLRLRTGRRWTQGDLGDAVGVERNTVSRWENGGMRPRDPVVLSALARTLGVTTDWLLDGSLTGQTADPAAEGSAINEHSESGYRPDAGALALLPESAATLVREYLRRLEHAACTPDQIAAAESILLAGANHGLTSAPVSTRNLSGVMADIDDAWDLVVRILRRQEIRP